MKLDRRELLTGALALGAGSLLAGAIPVAAKPRALRILVLGGTGFIGPHFVSHALSRGHHITLFNRGRTNSDMFPEATKLVGDRDNGLDTLKSGEWDAVLDNSGYVPRHVMDSAKLLKGRVGRYLFTSSVAAYDIAPQRLPLGPNSKLAELAEPGSEDVNKYYGPLKAVAEGYVNENYGEAATIVRPTYVAGPGDRTQRFTWWVNRIHSGGDVLAPGNPATSFSLIDVRDLAEFYLTLLEADSSGIFNAAGPAGSFDWGGLLHGIRATTNTEVRLHWVNAKLLLDQEVTGTEMPMWRPAMDGITAPLWDNDSSVAAGLRYRTLATTAIDTLEWYRAQSPEQQIFTRAGISPEKEQRVLATTTLE